MGDLARDILYDENFPFKSPTTRKIEYMKNKRLQSEQAFDKLMYLYQNQEDILPPEKDKRYQYLFNQIDRQGKKCLEEDDLNTIRALWVSGKLYHVWTSSPIRIDALQGRQSHKDVLEVYANYFRREFDYDFSGFSAKEQSIKYNYMTEKHERNDYVGWLFTCPESINKDSIGMVRTIGGCLFRFREYTNVPHGWALCWIWLHPYHRRRGILNSNWDLFKKEFEDFYVEPPFSDAMKSFLNKVGYQHKKT